MEKVPPCTPFKNFHAKKEKENFKDTDRRTTQAIQLALAHANGQVAKRRERNE